MRSRTRALKSASLVIVVSCRAAPAPQQPPRPADERCLNAAPRVRLPLPPRGGGLRPPHGGSARNAAVRQMISDAEGADQRLHRVRHLGELLAGGGDLLRRRGG